MNNIEVRLLREVVDRFEKFRDELNLGGGVVFEDAGRLAKFLGLSTRKMKCYVCGEEQVVVLRDYSLGGQDEDAHHYDICLISGCKVERKGSKATEPVCQKCFSNKQGLRTRVLAAVSPVLKRFDELSL